MQITNVEPVALTAPYIRPYTPADHPANGVRSCVWVRIETSDGVTGWGEAYCGCYATEVTMAALRRFRRSLLGRDPLDPETALAFTIGNCSVTRIDHIGHNDGIAGAWRVTMVNRAPS